MSNGAAVVWLRGVQGLRQIAAGTAVRCLAAGLGSGLLLARVLLSAMRATEHGMINVVALINEVVASAEAITAASLGFSHTVTRLALQASHHTLSLCEHLQPTVVARAVLTELQSSSVSAQLSAELGHVTNMFRELFAVADLKLRLSGVGRAIQCLQVLQQEDGRSWPGIGRQHLLKRDIRMVDVCALPHLQELVRCVNYSMATYGHVPLKFLGLIKFGAASSDIAAVCVMTGVPQTDIVAAAWSPKLFRPGYLLFVDKANKSVVVALRGSLWPHDALTDLACTATSFTATLPGLDSTEREYTVVGVAHDGMLRSAQDLSSELLPLVTDLMLQSQDYKLLITGHSLGAGVAALLVALWSSPSSLGSYLHTGRMKGVGFGCPAVLSASIGQCPRLRQHFTSVVIGDDMVPRFSLATFEDLLEKVLEQWEEEARKGEAALDATENNRKPLATDKKRRLREPHSSGIALTSQSLRPAGTVLWLAPSSGTVDSDEHGPGCRIQAVELAGQAAVDEFAQLYVTRSMFSEHMPDNYHRRIVALQAAHLAYIDSEQSMMHPE